MSPERRICVPCKAALCCSKARTAIETVEQLTEQGKITDEAVLTELAEIADKFADKFAKVAIFSGE